MTPSTFQTECFNPTELVLPAQVAQAEGKLLLDFAGYE